MPELSDRQREKAATLESWFATTRLVVALERKWELHFQCLTCGATKTWRRDTMLGRARPLLNCTMADIQRRVPCPQCGRRRPRIRMSGTLDPGPHADQFRMELITTLLDVGLSPTDYGYGWRPPGGPR